MLGGVDPGDRGVLGHDDADPRHDFGQWDRRRDGLSNIPALVATTGKVAHVRVTLGLTATETSSTA